MDSLYFPRVPLAYHLVGINVTRLPVIKWKIKGTFTWGEKLCTGLRVSSALDLHAKVQK